MLQVVLLYGLEQAFLRREVSVPELRQFVLDPVALRRIVECGGPGSPGDDDLRVVRRARDKVALGVELTYVELQRLADLRLREQGGRQPSVTDCVREAARLGAGLAGAAHGGLQPEFLFDGPPPSLAESHPFWELSSLRRRIMEIPDSWAGGAWHPLRADYRRALEATNYLSEHRAAVPSSAGRGRATMTELAIGGRSASERALRAAQSQVRQQVHRALNSLLAEVRIEVPHEPAARASNRVCDLLRRVVGHAAFQRFRDLYEWLERDVRRRDPALPFMRLLAWMAPELLERHHRGPWRFQLSYCLYLRSLLKDHCRREGWRLASPGAPEQDAHADAASFDAAFDALDRERIGQIVAQAVTDLGPDDCRILAACS